MPASRGSRPVPCPGRGLGWGPGTGGWQPPSPLAWGASVSPHVEEASAEHPSPLRPLSTSWAAGQRREEAGLPAESRPGCMRDLSCCRGAGLRHGCGCSMRTGQRVRLPGRLPRLGAPLRPCPAVPGRGLGGHGAGLGLADGARERSAPALPALPGSAAGTPAHRLPSQHLILPHACPCSPPRLARAGRCVVAWLWHRGPRWWQEGLLVGMEQLWPPSPCHPALALRGHGSGKGAGRQAGAAGAPCPAGVGVEPGGSWQGTVALCVLPAPACSPACLHLGSQASLWRHSCAVPAGAGASPGLCRGHGQLCSRAGHPRRLGSSRAALRAHGLPSLPGLHGRSADQLLRKCRQQPQAGPHPSLPWCRAGCTPGWGG